MVFEEDDWNVSVKDWNHQHRTFSKLESFSVDVCNQIVVLKDSSENEVKKEIQNIKNIKDALSEKTIIKSIYVPNKILNIVVKTWTDTNVEDRKKVAS